MVVPDGVLALVGLDALDDRLPRSLHQRGLTSLRARTTRQAGGQEVMRLLSLVNSGLKSYLVVCGVIGREQGAGYQHGDRVMAHGTHAAVGSGGRVHVEVAVACIEHIGHKDTIPGLPYHRHNKTPSAAVDLAPSRRRETRGTLYRDCVDGTCCGRWSSRNTE